MISIWYKKYLYNLSYDICSPVSFNMCLLNCVLCTREVFNTLPGILLTHILIKYKSDFITCFYVCQCYFVMFWLTWLMTAARSKRKVCVVSEFKKSKLVKTTYHFLLQYCLIKYMQRLYTGPKIIKDKIQKQQSNNMIPMIEHQNMIYI